MAAKPDVKSPTAFRKVAPAHGTPLTASTASAASAGALTGASAASQDATNEAIAAWMCEQGRRDEATAGAMVWAAREGHLKIVQWLHAARGATFNEDTAAAAALGGNNPHLTAEARFAVLKWLRSKGCAWNSHVTLNAAKTGFLAMLTWARDNGCVVDQYTPMWVAEAGHTRILQYLATFMKFDADVCSGAARGGHGNTLRWLRETAKAPWDAARVKLEATRRGDANVLHYVAQSS